MFLEDVLPVVLAGMIRFVRWCCDVPLPNVLFEGLSDAIGPVRDVALKAGQVIYKKLLSCAWRYRVDIRVHYLCFMFFVTRFVT